MFGRKMPATESRRNVCSMLWRRCIAGNSVTAVGAIVTVRDFAVECGDKKFFALIELFGRGALFKDFDRKIFCAIFANYLADK